MPGRYTTPRAFKAALDDRLRSQASGDGLELQRIRQLVVFERYLARLFAHLGDAVMLKGGMVLELRLERARTTKDLDLRMVGSPSDTLVRLQEAGRLDLDDFFTFLVVPDPRHPTIDVEGMTYEGLRFRVECRLADKIYGRPFSLDVAFAEPIMGSAESLTPGGWLTFAGVPAPALSVVPLETHIAEKLHAYTLPRTRPNTRVKDLPDLALLGGVREIGGAVLRSAIERTWAHRGTHPLPAALPSPPPEWVAPYADMAAASDLPWRSLDDVADAARKLIDPVLGIAVPEVWSPERAKWR